MPSDDTLQRISELVGRDPHSAAALTLYALINTLAFPKAGCLFKLDKLKDLSAEERQLAYGLMEMMAQGRVADEDWRAAKESLDELVRRG